MNIFEYLGLNNITTDLLESVLVLSAVIILILFLGWLVRRFFFLKSYKMSRHKGRLRVEEVVNIDTRTRLVLCAFEDREYLLLLSDGRPLVIDGYIPQKPEEQPEDDEKNKKQK